MAILRAFVNFLGGFTGCPLDDQPKGWGIKLGYLLNHLQVEN